MTIPRHRRKLLLGAVFAGLVAINPIVPESSSGLVARADATPSSGRMCGERWRKTGHNSSQRKPYEMVGPEYARTSPKPVLDGEAMYEKHSDGWDDPDATRGFGPPGQ